jgi:hypothetical protein
VVECRCKDLSSKPNATKKKKKKPDPTGKLAPERFRGRKRFEAVLRLP